ncbi:hypothetical protein [Promicromonospora panici]|uniref:hypothetical protein n=1 Tax=Promicromonospora panici TaxID=2219658 RepID=UPI001A934788|nr:hypothetical protein [Promicromonospora panici]
MVGLTGVMMAGLVGVTAPAVADNVYAKRPEALAGVVVTMDDDDNDPTTRSRASKSTRGTGSSRSRNDNTNSRYTAVSRDRDRSRGDKTKDRTADGPRKGLVRDWSANSTNDRTRNDTRR